MEKHLNTNVDLVEKLAAIGRSMDEDMIVSLMFISLPNSYNTLITALESRDEKEITISFIKGKLKASQKKSF